MLKVIRQLFGGAGNETEQNVANLHSSPEIADYFMPRTAAELLAPPSRKQCLQQLWESCALPKDLYESFWLQPLHSLVSLMQTLPAAPRGEYALEGGLVDVMLRTTTFAVRLAKGHMLPPGAAPEEQAAQNVLWNTVVFYAGLFHFLPLLSQFEGEYQSGRAWLPGITVPDEPFRFRFHVSQLRTELSACQSALTAARLLPAGALAWLSTLPAAVNALTLTVARQPGPLPVIDELVREAVKLAGGGNLSVVPPPALTAASPATLSPCNPGAPQIMAAPSDVLLSTPVNNLPAADHDLPGNEHQAGITSRAPQSVAELHLSSALDTPANDRPLAEITVVSGPAADTDDETLALLSLMAADISAPATPDLQKKVGNIQEGKITDVDRQASARAQGTATENKPGVTEANVHETATLVQNPLNVVAAPLCRPVPPEEQSRPATTSDAAPNSGEIFWQWLADGLNSGGIAVNTAEARVHLVSGFVFLDVPGIFYLYLKQSAPGGEQREVVQDAFERLDRHRRVRGKRFWFAHLYKVSGSTGPHKRTKGYLIKASLIYRGKTAPGDSPVLVMP